MAELTARIGGLDGLVARCNGDMLLGPPLEAMFQQSALEIENRAKALAPRDLGTLQRSIHHYTGPGPIPRFARVTVGALYAADVEFGTRPHWPPISALQGWAQRHGIPAFLVARAISRRGTKARPFLMPAYRELVNKINGRMGGVARAVEARWRAGGA